MFDSFTQPQAMSSGSKLEPRYTCYGYNSYGRCIRRSSRWYDWGRWVLLGVIIFVFLIIFFLVSCTGARRRRKMGSRPMYGTGWLAPQAPPGHGQASYYGPGGSNNQQQDYQYNNQSAPAYNQGGAANSYYGQSNNVEMQAPQQTYQPQAGSNYYAPPSGPPPGK